MTDKTDIAELREAAIKATQGEWKDEFYDDERGYKTWFIDLSDMPAALIVDNTGIELNGTGNPTEQDELNVKYVALANPSTILALLAQLEAERQRADKAESNYSDEADARKQVEQNYVRLEAEIAALKTDIESYISISGELATEVEALKSKLANPVVLPDLVTNALQSNKPFSLFDIIRATQHGDAEAIIAAGFTVKGE